MEGYLHVYHKKRYAKFWCVLDGQQLSYYERIDLHAQLPVGIKGIIYVKNAGLLSVVHETRPNVIRIKPDGRKAYEYIDCEKAQGRTTWYQCLLRATKLHEAQISRNKEMEQCARLLGIDSTVKLSQRVVSRAYRKICLKAHPDKGGDAERFNEISAAHTKLMAIQADIEAREQSDEIEYEAIVEKGPEGIGLGLLVVEDPLLQRIIVKKMNDNIILHGLSAEAGGEILPSDCLVGIDKDDCMRWPITRVLARLNVFRLPVGGTVLLRFQRRLAVESLDEAAEQDLNMSGMSAGAAPEETAAVEQQPDMLNSENEQSRTQEIREDEKHRLWSINDSGNLNVAFEKLDITATSETEPINESIVVQTDPATIPLEEYRKIYMELESIKKALKDSESISSSWREKANTLLQDVELLRKARDEDAEIIRQYKDSAERYQTEIVFLKTKVQNTEDISPETATDVLQVSRSTSFTTLDQVFEIKKDKKLISDMLSELRFYCSESALITAETSASDGSICDRECNDWEERANRYRQEELNAEDIANSLMQLIEQHNATLLRHSDNGFIKNGVNTF